MGKPYRTSILALEDGLLSENLDKAFMKFAFGERLSSQFSLSFSVPRWLDKIGLISPSMRLDSEYSAWLKSVPSSGLENEADEFAKMHFEKIAIPDARRIVSCMDDLSEEMVFVTESISILATACIRRAFGLRSFSVVGNELEKSKGVLSGRLSKEACSGSSRFLSICDALSRSPDEIWLLGSESMDAELIPFADAALSIKNGSVKALKGEEQLRKASIVH